MAEFRTETAKEHFYTAHGVNIRGYGPSMDPHRCGDPTEPCVTYTYERQVSEWELVDAEVNTDAGT